MLTAHTDPALDIDPAEQGKDEAADPVEAPHIDDSTQVIEKPAQTQFMPTPSTPAEPASASSTTGASVFTFSVHDALEIAQTCALAGRTDLTAAFIEAQVSPSKVRARLLADKADRSTEIISRIDPSSAVGGAKVVTDAATENLMVRTVKSRLATR